MPKIAAAVILMTAAVACSNMVPYFSSGEKTVPILAWWSLIDEELSLENFQDLADAGFNLSFSGLRDSANVALSLDLAGQVGVKLMLNNGFDDDGKFRNLYKSHPALAGYTIRDEPSAKDFSYLADCVAQIKENDPASLPYINLLPNYAVPDQLGCESYEAYIRRFLEEVGTPYISYDHYAIVSPDHNPEHIVLRDSFFENLEIVSRVSKEKGIPFYAFTLTANHYDYYCTTEGSVRFHAWCDFAYGAQMLQYFTYSSPRFEGYRYSILDSLSQKTPEYEMVKQFNKEIQGLSDILMGSDVHSVCHVGRPAHLRGLHELGHTGLPDKVRTIETGSPKGFLASYFTTDGEDYLMLVNMDWNNPAEVSAVPASRSARIFVKDTSVPSQFVLARVPETISVAPGDMALIRL